MKLKSFALAFFTVSIATVAGMKAAQAASFQVVADGLNNPRGIAFDPSGNLYVTESGSGGDAKDGRCIPSFNSSIPFCAAENGSVLKVTTDGKKETVLNNLPSIALSPYGEQAVGPADFKFDDKGNAYLLTGLTGNPEQRDTVFKTPLLGRLFKVDLNTGSLTSIADFSEYEAKYNPDGTDLASNPYAFTIKGDTAYVVDAAGNDIYSVALDGSGIKNVAAFPQQLIPPDQLQFPPVPAVNLTTTDQSLPPLPPGYTVGSNGIPVSNQSVPTGIAIAPDGSLTVSEYTYFPYPEGKARIFKVSDDLQITELATGFTQLTGVTYDQDGNLYALQHVNQSEWKAIEQGGNIIGDPSSSVIKIAPDGTRTTIFSGDGLIAASDITLGPDGDLYISNNSRFVGKGQVIKIDPRTTSVPEPSSGLGLLAVGVLGATAAMRRLQMPIRVGPLCSKTL